MDRNCTEKPKRNDEIKSLLQDFSSTFAQAEERITKVKTGQLGSFCLSSDKTRMKESDQVPRDVWETVTVTILHVTGVQKQKQEKKKKKEVQ